MTEDDAIDRATLTFIDLSVDESLRDRLRIAIREYNVAVVVCPACRGSGTLIQRGSRVYLDDGHRAASQPVEDGATMACIACGGHGVDNGRLRWACFSSAYGCRPEQETSAGHEGCGWV